MDIDLELLDIDAEEQVLSVPGMDNIRAYIRSYGLGLSFEAPIQARLKDGANGPIQAQILAPTISAPTQPLAVHTGQGSVFLAWSHAESSKVDYFELYIATSLGGTYVKLPRGEFYGLHGIVQNIPLGRSYFFQLRAVGKNGALSSFTQVKLGKFYRPSIVLKVRAITGSVLKANAIFTSVNEQTGNLLAVQVPADTTIN